MTNIILEVTVEEGNKIINALAEMPFKNSFELIAKLQKQATEQLGQQKSETTNNPQT